MLVALHILTSLLFTVLGWGVVDQILRYEFVDRYSGRGSLGAQVITWIVWCVLVTGTYGAVKAVFPEIAHSYASVFAILCGVVVRMAQVPSTRDVRRLAVILGSRFLQDRGCDPATVDIRGYLEDTIEDIEAKNGYGFVPSHVLHKRYNPLVLMLVRPPFSCSVLEIESAVRRRS